jgi:protein-S-isoprenylcysteine O-methyltransferase Ste14
MASETPMNAKPETSLKIIAPPPVLYLGTLLCGVLLHVVRPGIWWSPEWHLITGSTGAILFMVSIVFARWAFLSFRKAGTSANPGTPATALCSDGAFALSRNPVYLAMSGIYLGLSLMINSWYLPVLLIPLLIGMHWGVILPEERYLSSVFGKSYAAYRAKVRRWL